MWKMHPGGYEPIKYIEITLWAGRAYGIFSRIGDISKISLARCACSFNFWYKQWTMFSLRLTQTDSLSIYEIKMIYNDPLTFRLDKVWFVLEIRLFTFSYFPVKSSWSINNRYRRLFLFQRDRAEGVVGVGLYKLDSVHLKLRWSSVTSRLSSEQKIGDYEKSNLKLT